ncbi:MAG: hypothetical protein A3H72_02240 [Candidatus Doudnabacteria bacterium RIFCSPLOWO2_02_FULL_48_8]|uniref:Uncharacterized protein n=1 Tax=Candidatus Doudnabacteria bacterium RIFCSPHIGHO2_01_FULL_46_24 TaxID=1817825 RepID=A0A1F5NTK7_9BACT|nr:MAG: hypothetical protein A2720_00420 [Candidatus Doudnabacteria bacterium RIFCSPHIGHO2_01_FULL_46_24]OGE95125.1 MAG: hypothetical protein A3H72_02240 [Candidatus Doudnabacteria bacterium RIFCSPLOWO2_02_FULL_48_8]OGE95713.1 MAG: hypothetical protein A3E98_03620 [Candidatus Doudnabacteria bacterium RIFCSPHIGHO2_12_FULL_48_11]
MLTDEDIVKIVKAVTKAEVELFPSKADFEDLRKDFRSLQTSVDNYSKKTDDYHLELAVYKHKVNQLEAWVKEAAKKLGLSYNQ